MNFGLGCDLGQVNDPAAIVVVQKIPNEHPDRTKPYPGDILHARHIERMALRTSYPDVVRRIATLMDTPPLRGNCDLVVDHTGVGRAPVDMMREAGLTPIAISITAGAIEQRKPSANALDRNVPKKELIAALRMLFESRPQRLRIAANLKYTDAIIKELTTFTQKISQSGRATFEALRESDHDDIVLALGLVCWWCAKSPLGPAIMEKPAVRTEAWYKEEADKLTAARTRNIKREIRRRNDPDFQEDDEDG